MRVLKLLRVQNDGDLPARGQIGAHHLQLVHRQVAGRLVDHQQVAVLRDAAVGGQVDRAGGEVAALELLDNQAAQLHLPVSGGGVDGVVHRGDDVVNRGGELALRVKLRVVRIAVHHIAVVVHHQDIVKVDDLLPAGLLAAHHDGVLFRLIVRQDARAGHRVHRPHAQMVGQGDIPVQKTGDAAVHVPVLGHDDQLHIGVQRRQVVHAGVRYGVDPAAGEVNLQQVGGQIAHRQVKDDDDGHHQRDHAGGEEAVFALYRAEAASDAGQRGALGGEAASQSAQGNFFHAAHLLSSSAGAGPPGWSETPAEMPWTHTAAVRPGQTHTPAQSSGTPR